MRKQRIRLVLRKVTSVVLMLMLIMGILAEGLIGTAHAALPLISPPLILPPQVTENTEEPIPEVITENSLPSDTAQSAQAEAMGLPTTQPARIGPDGKEVDKNQNPLGPDSLSIDRVYQLALTKEVNNRDNLIIYNNAISGPILNMRNPIPSLASQTSDNWNAVHREVVAADVNGDGTQEVVTVGLVKTTSMATNNTRLELFVTDYNTRIPEPNNSKLTRPSASALYTHWRHDALSRKQHKL